MPRWPSRQYVLFRPHAFLSRLSDLSLLLKGLATSRVACRVVRAAFEAVSRARDHERVKRDAPAQAFQQPWRDEKHRARAALSQAIVTVWFVGGQLRGVPEQEPAHGSGTRTTPAACAIKSGASASSSPTSGGAPLTAAYSSMPTA